MTEKHETTVDLTEAELSALLTEELKAEDPNKATAALNANHNETAAF